MGLKMAKADVLLTKKGKFVIATLKTPGGKLTAEEVEEIRNHLKSQTRSVLRKMI